MCRKTPAVAYYSRKLKITSRSALLDELKDAPISKNDFDFIQDIIDGLSYKEISEKYSRSLSRVYQWKRSIFERLHQYDMSRLC